MKIGIISDTHSLLRPEVRMALEGCEAIIHAGDINRQEILDELEEIAPVYAARGNTDGFWAGHIPYFLDFELAGKHIYVTHRKVDLPEDLSGYDLVVFGHSHEYEESRQGKTVLLNPGSCGPERFHQGVTMATAELSGGGIEITRIDISGMQAAAFPGTGKVDLRKQIEIIMKETRKGKSPAEIAGRYGFDYDLTVKIVRLHLTHPGAGAGAIMTKMGY